MRMSIRGGGIRAPAKSREPTSPQLGHAQPSIALNPRSVTTPDRPVTIPKSAVTIPDRSVTLDRNTQYGRNFYCFGDLESFKPGDRYHTVLCADDRYWSINNQYLSYPGQYNGYGLTHSLDVGGKVILRNHTQVGNYVRWGVTSLNTNNGQQVCGRGNLPFPNGADYSLWLMPTYVRQEDGHLRGMMPGMYWMHQDRPYTDQTIIDNVVGQSGRRFLLVRTQYSSEAEGAQVAFDITGPWR